MTSVPVNSSLKERIKGALIFGVIVLSALYFGGNFFVPLMLIATGISIYEWDHD